jgi:hypothetical protein
MSIFRPVLQGQYPADSCIAFVGNFSTSFFASHSCPGITVTGNRINIKKPQLTNDQIKNSIYLKDLEILGPDESTLGPLTLVPGLTDAWYRTVHSRPLKTGYNIICAKAYDSAKMISTQLCYDLNVICSFFILEEIILLTVER